MSEPTNPGDLILPEENSKEENTRSKPEAEQKKKPRKRFAERLAMALTGFVAISVTATEMMMFIIFGRNAEIDTRPFALEEWARVQNYRWVPLEFRSGDNLLKGYVVAPWNPKAVVVMVHGIRSSSNELEPVTQYLTEQGYAVATFDGTASGRSQGDKTVGLQQQRFDLRAALIELDRQGLYTDLPLILFGHSAGAYGVATEAPETRASAVVCVSGFDTPLGTMRAWAAQYTGPLSTVEYPFLLIRELIAKGEEANTAASSALRRSGIPAIVIHGAKDDVVKKDISLYQAVSENGAPQISLIWSDEHGHSDILVSDSGINKPLMQEIVRELGQIIGKEGN